MAIARKSGRKPADAGTPGRQEIWEAIRKIEGPFMISDLVNICGADRKTIHDYLRCLAAGDYVTHTPAPHGQPATYELINDTGHHAPQLRRDGTPVTQGQATLQMWRSMRILKTFTYRDLIETASVEIAETTAKSYCNMLLSTGYLRVLKKANPFKKQIAQYRLIRNDGPKPPKIQRVKQVYDPNTNEVYVPEGRS